MSRYNDFQEFAARLIAVRLLQQLRPDDIVILCLYTATRDALRKLLAEEQIRVHTVDGFQGKEAPIVILVTTRVLPGEASKESTRFFLDQQRLTVALSRAKDGIIIIGDVQSLIQSSAWKIYLSEVTIVDYRYLDVLQRGSPHRSPTGVLFDVTGRSITAPITSELSERWIDDPDMLTA